MRGILFGFLICFSVWAETPSESDKDFLIDKNLFNQLYEDSLKKNKIDDKSLSSGLRINVGVSYLDPKELTFKNNYFQVPYTSEFGGLPTFLVTLNKNIFEWGPVTGNAGLTVGYSYKTAIQKAYPLATQSAERTTLVTLHRLPLSLGMNLNSALFNIKQIRPFLVGKIGMEWFYQSGQLDGLEQGFWIPFAELGGGLTLFPGDASDWFQGVSLTVLSHQGMESVQKVSGLNFDLSLNILL